VRRWIGLLSLLWLVCAGTAAAAEWHMDPTASELSFQVSYQGAPAPGSFKQFGTQLRFDPARPAGGALNVTVKMASVDMGSADINEAIRGTEWLDLGKYAQAEFTSADIKRVADGRYIADGTLRLKGVQRPVQVPFTWMSEGNAARMKGELTLDRTAFGVGSGEWAAADPIALAVKVRFNVRLIPAS
jgi:polyisoprenoid-binding protein YceI